MLTGWSSESLLISEIIDPAAAISSVRDVAPQLPPAALAAIERHMTEQHLTAEQVGWLAQRAGVSAVTITHNGLGVGGARDAMITIREHFAGPVTFANDLDRF